MPLPSPLRRRLDTELRRELLAGERILWSAQPAGRRLAAGLLIWVFAVRGRCSPSPGPALPGRPLGSAKRGP